MSTTRESLKLLCKSMIGRLENQKSISFMPRIRQIIQDEVYTILARDILTDEDIKERVFQKMGAAAEQLKSLTGENISETDAFKAAKAVVKATVSDHEINGFYFQIPVKKVAEKVLQYLMKSSHIDDVYETDEDLVKKVVEIIQKFKESDVH